DRRARRRTLESRVPAGVAPADYGRPAAWRAARWTYPHALSWRVDPLLRARVGVSEGGSRGATFTLRGRSYRYGVHLHNQSWRNERIVELPIVLAEMAARPGARTLELGNVVAHYTRRTHDVVDKAEPSPGVVNEDIVDFRPAQPYDLVVSVSTLEHVGFDEDVRDPQKVLRAVEAIRRLLAPGGLAVVTLPLGYNPELDAHLDAGRLRFDRTGYLKRVSAANAWVETEWAGVRGSAYGRPFTGANGL